MSHPAARTLADALVAAAAARPVRSTILIDSELQARPIPHEELLWLARQASVALLEAGLRPGDRTFLVLPTGQDFLAAFFGCLLSGIVPCPMSPPLGSQSLSAFETRLAQLARALDVRGLLAPPEVADGAGRELGPGFLALTPDLFASPRDTAAGPPAIAAEPEGIAFLQLTSGSTALPKGVLLPHRTVCTNLRQMATRSGFLPGDVSVSWLPLFHDMGLISGVLLPLTYQQDLLLSTPYSFLRRPAHWLHAVSRYRGTHSTAPTFSYRQIVDRLAPRDLAGLDLASWRIAFVGAEPVHAEVLERFERMLAPYGLAETALTPCYGMAETTLAATAKPDGERYRTRALSRRALAAERRVADPEGPEDELVLVDCGEPLEGTHVSIVDEAGRELPEGREGEIVVRGPSVFAGYAGLAEPGLSDPSRESLAAGFRTGDLGFLDRGGLFITGRKKDVIIISGENHHPAEIEWAVAGVEGVRPTRVAAIGIPDPELGTERLCVMVESERRAGAGAAEPLDVAIRRRVREETGLLVYDVEVVPAGTIPMTTSGKIRRAQTKQIFLEILASRAVAREEPGMVQDAV